MLFETFTPPPAAGTERCSIPPHHEDAQACSSIPNATLCLKNSFEPLIFSIEFGLMRLMLGSVGGQAERICKGWVDYQQTVKVKSIPSPEKGE